MNMSNVKCDNCLFWNECEYLDENCKDFCSEDDHIPLIYHSKCGESQAILFTNITIKNEIINNLAIFEEHKYRETIKEQPDLLSQWMIDEINRIFKEVWIR